MKRSCSLFVFLSVLLSSSAVRAVDIHSLNFVSTGFTGISPPEKLTVFEMIGNSAGSWNRRFLTYKFSDRLDMGVVRTGCLGSGVGFEYHFTKHVILWGAVLRSHDTGKKIPMVGIRATF